MLERLKVDDGHAKKTGDVLLEILHKCDDNRKALIIAKLFSDYISGYISFEKFNRFSRIINQAYLFDLSILRDYVSDPSLIGADVSLLTLGVIGIKTKIVLEGTPVSLADSARSKQIEYYVNDNGKELFDAIKFYV